MGRSVATLRFLAGMLAPGGVLVLATWAVQREEVVRSAAAPYAVFFCFGALVQDTITNVEHARLVAQDEFAKRLGVTADQQVGEESVVVVRPAD